MENTFTYLPYKNYKWFVTFGVAFAIIFFVLFGLCMPNIEGVIASSVMGVLSVFLTKGLYDCSNTAMFFEEEGLRIIGGKYVNNKYFRWEEFSYAYYVKGFRGNVLLVLSPKSLDFKEARKYAFRVSTKLSPTYHFDSVAVVPVVSDKYSSTIKEQLMKHSLNVQTFKGAYHFWTE